LVIKFIVDTYKGIIHKRITNGLKNYRFAYVGNKFASDFKNTHK